MDLEQAMQEIFYHGFVFTLRPKKALEALKVIRKTLLDYKQLKADYIELDKQLRTANTEIDRLQSVSSFVPCGEMTPEDNTEVIVYDDCFLIATTLNDTSRNTQRKDDTHDND